ncbi:centrosomal protein of 152 kDa [Stegostoma tigrinum]|uniref:centrosomal protein of 152 kDa n=1 Tax=Stegostoma tigrinum TaxID=3053191 RepID=UPI00202ADAD0|nr:centrosomal protein of 152 kDa [Stegostoma tigrinum]XP_048418782.1 centrosomal protein of 152 kDa [Stegostoma tigrinum]
MMSMDFDSVALPTQHEDEEYDREDYEREQELHQLLMTGLPDDMLEDSRDISSPELNYSGCHVNNGVEQTWEQKRNWNDQEVSNIAVDKESYSTECPVYKGQNGHFIANENISNETLELYKVKYNPYPAVHPPKGAFNPDETKSLDNRFEQMQSKFLDSGEETHQFAQLQILYNARGRQLEEMQHKQEEFARDIRYLNHQLAMTKGEKDGVAISCQELQKLLQDAKEREVQLEGQIKALESRVQDLSASEEEAIKNEKIAEAAMESMQQQLSELSRSESLTRVKEQHETIIYALKQKHEESILVMQQSLGATSIALEEQQENCKQLQEQVKQLERQQEAAKLEKAEIINGLTRSLEASQQQCRDLLQTGSVQEIAQLRIQVQQVHSAKNISDSMNKALQEELADLKEQITFYESAAKISALTKDVAEELELPLSDSYMDLAIKNGKWKMPRFPSSIQQGGSDKVLSKDEIIMELKSELERALSNIRTKRHQVTQLQHESKESQKQTAEIKEQLQNAEKMARSHEVRASTLEKQLEALRPCSSNSEKALQEEVDKLRCENQALRKEIEDKQQQIEKLIDSEKQFKEANQELYNEMRQMIQDFDQDKQEAIDRCQRIHQQHHEDSKCRLQQELQEQHELEKTQLTQFYKQQIMQVNNHLEQLNHEMSGVQECYITICKEKDSLESKLREEMSLKLITTEQEMKKAFSEEMRKHLSELQAELEEKHKTLMVAAKNKWMLEKETDIGQQVEKHVALAKIQWQEEQQKVKDQEMHDVETEWQLRLRETAEATKQKTSPPVDEICQTEESTGTRVYTCQELESQLADLKITLECQAKEEKVMAVGEALKQLELELQKKHEDNVVELVETALANARCRWLEELTNLPEYRANLQIEEKKWEAKYEQYVAEQVATAVKANDEKWKKHTLKEIEKMESSVKTSELQERTVVLERKLKLEKEEAAAVVKAELAKARTQWNKAKQVEINRIHELNEQDYQAFLAEHRNKLSKVLKEAKEDFTRQKNELIAQKEAEFNLRLSEKQKEWSTRREEQINFERQQYEAELVAEIERFLRDISKHFGKSKPACLRAEEYSNTAKSTHDQFVEVKDHLQRVCTEMVEEILETQKEEDKLDLQNALSECERQHEEYKAAKEAELRKLESSELQLKQEFERLQYKLRSFAQQNLVSGKETLSPEYQPCDEQCRQQTQKLQQECQQLKKKLEKVCRQLQQTVHEHSIEVQHLKEEHQRTINILQNKNDCLVRRLKESESTDSKTNSCLQENCNPENSCKLISAKGLEEIRCQYLRAVDKIRGDMMRYIQESKKRAAEMIRAEVLKERQQTARKMRKYYLTCLHQLLVDGGNNDGAEKRIMNAASKLAAMAKALETPLPNRKRDKAETLTACPNMKSSKQTPVISENDQETSGSTHVRANHVEKPSSNEDQVQKFKKHTTGTVFMPRNLNNNLYGATAENGISDEELPTSYKQVNIHKIKETSDILQKDTALFYETKDGHQLNDAMSKSEFLKTANLAHFQNLAKYPSQMCNSKAPTLNSIDSHKDRTSLQMACNQDCVLPAKAYIHNSEVYVCSKPMTRAPNNAQTPERDGDFVTHLEAIRPCQMDTFNFRQAGGKVCHVEDCSTPIMCNESSGTSKPRSATNGAPQMSPSISSVTSEISSLSDGEHACFSSKTIPFVSRIDAKQMENVAESTISAINRDPLRTKTKPPKCIECTELEQELALNGWTAKMNKLSHQKYPSHLISNTDIIQQDSGFDSPFFH